MFNQKLKREKIITLIGFVIIFFIVGIFVYMSDDENNTLKGLFRINYLIPTALYSIGTVIICYLIFILLKKKIAKTISFLISVIVGISIGIYLMTLLIRLCVYIYQWIDILINTR